MLYGIFYIIPTKINKPEIIPYVKHFGKKAYWKNENPSVSIPALS